MECDKIKIAVAAFFINVQFDDTAPPLHPPVELKFLKQILKLFQKTSNYRNGDSQTAKAKQIEKQPVSFAGVSEGKRHHKNVAIWSFLRVCVDL